jgi:hypothetical protein
MDARRNAYGISVVKREAKRLQERPRLWREDNINVDLYVKAR